MHSSISDKSAAIHRGTKVRKMHTSRRDAFQSINAPIVATVDFEGDIKFNSPYRKRSSGKVKVRKDMERNVALLYSYPGMSPTIFGDVIRKSRGVVIAGSGLGHIPSEIVPEVRAAVNGGTVVVMTSQCLSGRVNLNVYDTGRDLVSAGVISGEDMLPETAYVKLMWALGNASSDDEAKRLMTTDLRGEITSRREIDE